MRAKIDIKNNMFYLGILGICLAVAGGVGFYATVSPPFLTADEVLHVDYAYQISNGDLPDFYEGPVAPIDSSKPSLQFVSQHPPLYYLMISPLVSSQIDSGNTERGVLLARMLTILMAVFSVLAFAWAGWELSSNNKELFALTLSGIATSLTPFVMFAGAVYNDILAVLFSTLALALIMRIIKNGLNFKTTIVLGVICAMAMAARATSINIVALGMLFVFISAFLHKESGVSNIKTATKGAFHSLIIPSLVFLVIGWFYIRNRVMSGSFTRSVPQEWAKSLGRKYKSPSRVLTTPRLWTIVASDQYGRAWKSSSGINTIASQVMVGFLSALSVLRTVSEKVFKQIDPIKASIIGLFLLQIALTFSQQVSHAVGYGGYNVRYFLPMQLPIAFIFSYGIFQMKKSKGLMVVLLLIANWAFVLLNTLYLYMVRRTSASSFLEINFVIDSIKESSYSPTLIYISLLMLIVGVVTQSIAILSLSKRSWSS